MSTILPTQSHPTASRTSSVVIGKTDPLSVVLRLAAMELYKLRRRKLSNVLIFLGLGAIIILFLAIFLIVNVEESLPVSSFAAAPTCSSTSTTSTCVSHPLPQATLAKRKQTTIDGTSQNFQLPGSLFAVMALAVITGFLTPLIIILTGAMVGGEYSFGTLRLIFTRGPTRIQFLLAKVLATLICAALGLLAMAIVGLLLGYLLHFGVGSAFDLHFFKAAWLGHAFLYLLMGILGWFTFAMIAVFFGTLGRSITAAIVGGIIWIFIEPVLKISLLLSANSFGSSIGNFLSAIPKYFISTNIDTLLQNQANFMQGTSVDAWSDLHALLIIAAYLVVTIGLSCWLTLKRDVTQ